MRALPQSRMVFVSGMKKSGTNWVANLLATHPDVVASGELHLEELWWSFQSYAQHEWTALGPDAAGQVWPEVVDVVVARFRADLLDAAGRRDDGRVVVVDHTPTCTHLHLADRARYIHIERDVRDVIVSDAFHAMRTDEYPPEVLADQQRHVDAWRVDPSYFRSAPEALVHPREADRLARTWVDIVTKAADLEAQHPHLVTMIRYEALHADVLGGRDRLLEFVGLDPGLASCDLPDLLRPDFGGRPEDPWAFYRKGAVGDHRNYANEAFLAIVEDIAGPLLRARSYL